jgi:F420-non-reducing hydrogenase small subunit
MKVSVVSLTCCAGCVCSFLNAGEAFLEILSEDFEIVYSPTFVDLKEVPNVDLAIVEGGVRTKEDERLIREVRAKSRILVALGICATHGGITSLGNMVSAKKLSEGRLTQAMTTSKGFTSVPSSRVTTRCGSAMPIATSVAAWSFTG